MKYALLSTTCSTDFYDWFENEMKKHNLTNKSKVVRDALEYYFENNFSKVNLRNMFSEE